MKPTSRTLSWACVIILLVVGIFTALGMILMHKQPLVLQGEAEATEIRISGKLPGRIDTFLQVSTSQSIEASSSTAKQKN